MRERINKPRVFLSHARKDSAFIERVERDLRKCQRDIDRYLYQTRRITQHDAVLPKNDLQKFSFHTPDLTQELYAYELLERHVEERSNRKEYVYFLSPKMYRFLFWAGFNHLVDEDLPIDITNIENKHTTNGTAPKSSALKAL